MSEVWMNPMQQPIYIRIMIYCFVGFVFATETSRIFLPKLLHRAYLIESVVLGLVLGVIMISNKINFGVYLPGLKKRR